MIIIEIQKSNKDINILSKFNITGILLTFYIIILMYIYLYINIELR